MGYRRCHWRALLSACIPNAMLPLVPSVSRSVQPCAHMAELRLSISMPRPWSARVCEAGIDDWRCSIVDSRNRRYDCGVLGLLKLESMRRHPPRLLASIIVAAGTVRPLWLSATL